MNRKCCEFLFLRLSAKLQANKLDIIVLRFRISVISLSSTFYFDRLLLFVFSGSFFKFSGVMSSTRPLVKFSGVKIGPLTKYLCPPWFEIGLGMLVKLSLCISVLQPRQLSRPFMLQTGITFSWILRGFPLFWCLPQQSLSLTSIFSDKGSVCSG